MAEAGSGQDRIRVEVAYALPDRQAILALDVAPGTTALDAARQSGMTDKPSGFYFD